MLILKTFLDVADRRLTLLQLHKSVCAIITQVARVVPTLQLAAVVTATLLPAQAHAQEHIRVAQQHRTLHVQEMHVHGCACMEPRA